ncbi:MAG: hypothetical protein QOH01_393 [Verrucomicrobiota bacterium]|jgi:hypothetical protein
MLTEASKSSFVSGRSADRTSSVREAIDSLGGRASALQRIPPAPPGGCEAIPNLACPTKALPLSPSRGTSGSKNPAELASGRDNSYSNRLNWASMNQNGSTSEYITGFNPCLLRGFRSAFGWRNRPIWVAGRGPFKRQKDDALYRSSQQRMRNGAPLFYAQPVEQLSESDTAAGDWMGLLIYGLRPNEGPGRYGAVQGPVIPRRTARAT